MRTTTYGRLQLTHQEVGCSLEELTNLSWAQSKVASIRASRFGFDIEVGPYAGTIVVHENLVITIDEMVPGTVEACLNLSSSGQRQATQKSHSGSTLPPLAAIAREFAAMVERELTSGPQKEYIATSVHSSRVRGKIHVGETVRTLWSRGRRDLLALRYRNLSEDTQVNRYLLAACNRAEHLLRDHDEARVTVQRCMQMLSGAQMLPDPAFPSTSPGISTDLQETLRVAEAIIRGVPFNFRMSGTSPFSAWVNIDRIFEEAVRTLCQSTAPADFTVTDGKSQKIPLFHAMEGEGDPMRKRADPDIVIHGHGKTGLLDAKYRKSGEKVTEDAIYQLIAHAGAFSADAAALVTPALHGRPGIRRLGRVGTGCPVDVIAVDPTQADGMSDLIGQWTTRLAQ
ncbi:5-methylcytosine restriction system specificity protein McrC [Streptomyces seoulensis]|uniref:5-methylcytosine restriction system specificity protein McrC n=1 Tax=Streptomyces seoulensis TaxID=73044 RepID=UPI003C2CF14E